MWVGVLEARAQTAKLGPGQGCEIMTAPMWSRAEWCMTRAETMPKPVGCQTQSQQQRVSDLPTCIMAGLGEVTFRKSCRWCKLWDPGLMVCCGSNQ